MGARESLNGRKNKARGKALFTVFFCAIFFRLFRLSLAPTICPWVSEDEKTLKYAYYFEVPYRSITFSDFLVMEMLILSINTTPFESENVIESLFEDRNLCQVASARFECFSQPVKVTSSAKGVCNRYINY